MQTFRDFMHHALYHPERGFYTSGRVRIGKDPVHHDFATHPELYQPFFGRAIGRIIHRLWDALGRPVPFWFVEMGSGSGQLMADALDEIRRKFPALLGSLRIAMVEISPALLYQQRQKLSDWPIYWYNADARNVDLPENLTGVFLANELVDAFPIHRVLFDGENLLEVYVEQSNDKFRETIGPLSSPDLSSHFERLGIKPAPGQHACVNLAASSWLRHLRKKLGNGYILVLDYGETADNLLGDDKSHVRVNRALHRGISPYHKPGFADITSDVDFTHLEQSARDLGFQKHFYGPEYHFLRGALPTADDKKEGFYDLPSLDSLLSGRYKALALGTASTSWPL